MSKTRLLNLYNEVHHLLRARVNHGHGADIPNVVHKENIFFSPTVTLTFTWINECNMQYGSNQDLIPIVEALENVTTLEGYMPVEFHSKRCNYEVFRHPGGGAVKNFVGGGWITMLEKD